MIKILKTIVNKVKRSMGAFRLMDNPIAQIHSTPTEKIDTRDAATKARVAKAFEQQAQQIQARALKAHQCADIFSCTRDVCFIVEPDKITGQYKATKEEVKKFKDQRNKNRNILREMSKDKLSKRVNKRS